VGVAQCKVWRALCLRAGARCVYSARMETNVQTARGDRHKPQRGPGGVWRRRTSAAPAVTLGGKLLALRAETAEGSRAREAAEAAFVADALPFLKSICRWYRGPDLHDEDLEATATLALCEAMREWRPGGRPFDTFARWGVRFALARMLRGSRMIRGRGRTAQVADGGLLHGLGTEYGAGETAEMPSVGRRVRVEISATLGSADDIEAELAERAGTAERLAECMALAAAVAELAPEDRAVISAWQAGSGRALPARLRARLREMVG